jgi:hypothetical protein
VVEARKLWFHFNLKAINPKSWEMSSNYGDFLDLIALDKAQKGEDFSNQVLRLLPSAIYVIIWT